MKKYHTANVRCAQAVREEILTVPYDDATKVVLGDRSVDSHAEQGQNPWQERRLEDDQPQEAQVGIGILSTPNVNQYTVEGRPEEAHGEPRPNHEEDGRGKGEEPRKVRG